MHDRGKGSVKNVFKLIENPHQNGPMNLSNLKYVVKAMGGQIYVSANN